jgi:hypothetical protein
VNFQDVRQAARTRGSLHNLKKVVPV